MISQMQRIIDNLQSFERLRAIVNINRFLNLFTEQIVNDDNDFVDFLTKCYEKNRNVLWGNGICVREN